MSKSQHPMSINLRKKMKKAIRSAIPTQEKPLKSNHIKVKDLLSRLPRKIQKKEKSLLQSFKKELSIKKKKLTAKHAKRTTPGLVNQKSPPQSIHIEGTRWIKTMNKQSEARAKVLNRKIAKKRTK